GFRHGSSPEVGFNPHRVPPFRNGVKSDLVGGGAAVLTLLLLSFPAAPSPARPARPPALLGPTRLRPAHRPRGPAIAPPARQMPGGAGQRRGRRRRPRLLRLPLARRRGPLRRLRAGRARPRGDDLGPGRVLEVEGGAAGAASRRLAGADGRTGAR